MAARHKYCWNCEFYHPVGLGEDSAEGKCRSNPPIALEGDGIPRVLFSSDCGAWKVNPEKVKIPHQDHQEPLQKCINSAITELEKLRKDIVRRIFEAQVPYLSLDEAEHDPIVQGLKHIINILNGTEEPEQKKI
jgi:hypothetical protein